jgi:hypothetical protein
MEFMCSGTVHVPFSYSSARPGLRIRIRQICHYYANVNINQTIPPNIDRRFVIYFYPKIKKQTCIFSNLVHTELLLPVSDYCMIIFMYNNLKFHVLWQNI